MQIDPRKWRFAITAVVLLAGGSGNSRSLAQPRREQDPGVRIAELRSSPALERIQRIAIAPPIIVLVFDSSGRLPDPNHYVLRRAVANELGPLVKELLATRKQTVLYVETEACLEETGQSAIDLVRTARGTEEVVRDKHKNVCHLSLNRAELRKDPLALTVFRFVPEALRDLSAGAIGIASIKLGTTPQWNAERVTALAKKLNVDAILVLRVEDMDHSKRMPGLRALRGLWTSVHATLLSADDGAVLWDASLEGYSVTVNNLRDPFLAGERWERTELIQALEGMARLAPVLVDHLAPPRS